MSSLAHKKGGENQTITDLTESAKAAAFSHEQNTQSL